MHLERLVPLADTHTHTTDGKQHGLCKTCTGSLFFQACIGTPLQTCACAADVASADCAAEDGTTSIAIPRGKNTRAP